MWITGFIVGVLIVAAAAGGWYAFARTRGVVPTLLRWLIAFAPLSAAVMIFRVLSIVASAPIYDWNGAKIAPAIGILKGYPLYPDPTSGVMTAWIYGPVPALLMLPAAMWSSPTWVIVVGVVINYIVSMAPTFWLHIGAMSAPSLAAPSRRRRGRRWFVAMAFLACAWLLVNAESMRRAAIMIAPDGPTIGMICCSLALLAASRTRRVDARGSRRRSVILMLFSAACAVLACWCKQSAIPALFAAPIYLLVADGPRVTAIYLACLASAGAVISGIFLFSFGASNMWFHMVTLSASHPWRDLSVGRATLLWKAVMLLFNELMPTLSVLAVVLLARRYLFPSLREGATSIKEWFAENVWITLPLTSLLLMPAALLGYLKIGGYVNNFSLVHWFLAVASTVYLTRMFSERDFADAQADVDADAEAHRDAPLPMRSCFAVVVIALLLFLNLPAMLLPKRKIEEMFQHIANVKQNQQDAAYAFAKQNPGKIYFPWNVLSSLLAEGKYYHFEWGIYDRLATTPSEGLRPSGAQIVAHLPAEMEIVAYGPFRQSIETMRIFPPAPGPYTVKTLVGFIGYPARRPAASVAEDLAARVRLFDDPSASAPRSPAPAGQR